jgi:plasmid stabilization system protein ParE
LRECIAVKNPAAAASISTQLVNSIQSLVDQPHMGHDIELPGVQEWIARDYVVHYVVRNDLLTILQIWHGKEDRA